MITTKDKKSSLLIFRPSVNIIRDGKEHFEYVVTQNAQSAYGQLVNNYKTGNRSFIITGAYGTGKSSFLVALEQTINGQHPYFSSKPFQDINSFEILKFIGEPVSFMEVFAEYLGVSINSKFRARNIFDKLDSYYSSLKKQKKGLLIVVDEFGKFLEHASKNNPERELYFMQQLAEYVSDPGKEILLITTLHQNFNDYARDLTKSQQKEWDKVSGRLKEITFNEPVEQLLFLASERLGRIRPNDKRSDSAKLFKAIEKSKAFPLRDYFNEKVAASLLPFDILSGSVLTLALQRYGQNERSLFSFIHSLDPLGLENYDSKSNPYYHLGCVYDYLVYNYYSLLTTKYNPDYAAWAGIRTAIEKTEGAIQENVSDAVKIIKAIGILNIFGSASIRLNAEFLKAYGTMSLGVKDPGKIIKSLEGLRIIRFKKHQERFILFDGTDLDIELAIDEAGRLVNKVKNVVHHLKQHFDFPYISAKSIHYEIGTPRYFSFNLTEAPIVESPKGEVDGIINLVFSDDLDEDELVAISKGCKEAILFGWYRNTEEIRNLLFEIDKVKKVREKNTEDKVAVRELDSILQHQVRLLNHYVIGSLYQQSPNLKWYYKGKEKIINDRRSFNKLLSEICRSVYHLTPAYRNEMVNKTKLSPPIQTAKKAFLKALTENWDKQDLGFEDKKFPPEKTIYLSLLRDTGIHRFEKGMFILGEPTKKESNLKILWDAGTEFLESSYTGRRNVEELKDIFLAPPFKLKHGFIEFWLPIFLFAKRDDYALFNKDGYIPFINQDTLELVGKDPRDYEIKAFHIDGVRLNLFNSYRKLLSQPHEKRPTNSIFIDTIRPFLTFYRKLPPYAKSTMNLDKRTLALRTAIATAKDPEDSFFVKFPKAIGYDITELDKSPKLLKQYSDSFQECLKEIRTCYDALVDRVEDYIVQDITGTKNKFPGYRTYLQNRYKDLKKYLLLPHQKSFYQRLYSEVNDRTAWLNSITHACINKPLEDINDAEELILRDKLKDLFHELDNLTDISTSGFDVEQEIAFKFEITSFVEGLKKNLVRLPKNKTKQLLQLQSVMKAKLTDDKQLNIATLAKMLEELLDNES